jgi:hypothetical protein
MTKAIFPQRKNSNPLAPKVKPVKRTVTYQQTYNKGTVAINIPQILSYIRAARSVFINKQTLYSDNSQEISLTIDISNKSIEKLKNPNLT